MNQVLAKVFNPNSMQFIQEWLQTIDSEGINYIYGHSGNSLYNLHIEHEIALTVLQDLAMRSQKYAHHSKHILRCKKMHTWPKRKTTSNDSSSSRSSMGQFGVQGVGVFRSHSACSHCSQNDIGATYNKHIKKYYKRPCLYIP